jgi:hypothetical protein
MKLGQNACLGNSDEFDGSGEQSRAIMALLFMEIINWRHFKTALECTVNSTYNELKIYSLYPITNDHNYFPLAKLLKK